jgi:hypothetical protein
VEFILSMRLVCPLAAGDVQKALAGAGPDDNAHIMKRTDQLDQLIM